MWGKKTTTVPVVRGAQELTKKGMAKYIKNILGNIQIKDLQKITVLGTSRMVRKALSIK